MKSEKFTVLELWEENKIRYIHFVLIYAGAKISEGYRKKYGKIPEKIEVYEKRLGRTFKVNQYPDSFREEANILLDKVLKRYRKEFQKFGQKKKKKRPRVKRQRVNSVSKYIKN